MTTRLLLLLLVSVAILLPSSAHGQRLPTERRSELSELHQSYQRFNLDSAATRGHAVTGLIVGAAVGLVAAYVLFAPGSNACSGSGDYEDNCRLYRAGIVVGGAGLGALIGSQIRTKK